MTSLLPVIRIALAYVNVAQYTWKQAMGKIKKAQFKIKKLYESSKEPSFSVPIKKQATAWSYIAEEFLMAASILDKKGPNFIRPRLQLTGHAIECSMKACIASVGAEPPGGSEGHDLVHLYEIIDKNGFHLEDRLQAMIVHLNHHYFQDLVTESRYKIRYPAKTTERLGGVLPIHSDMKAISNTLLVQAARRAPDTLGKM